jgi:hypothetical protein
MAVQGDHGQSAFAHGEIEVAQRGIIAGGEEKFGWLVK